MTPVRVQSIPVDDIYIVGPRREVGEKAVEALSGSLEAIGLRQPITVRWCDRIEDADGGYALVAGRHRLEAAKRIGWTWIDAIVAEWDDITAEQWEISENLHRAELSDLDRKLQIARWTELEILKRDEVSGHFAQKPQGGRPEGGVSAASRELGIERTAVRRAVKIAGSLSGEAQDAIREAGLSNSQKALLAVASAPQTEQVAKVHEIKAAKLAADPLNDFEAKEKQVAALMAAWNKAGLEAREEFLSRIDRPLMDRRYA